MSGLRRLFDAGASLIAPRSALGIVETQPSQIMAGDLERYPLNC